MINIDSIVEEQILYTRGQAFNIKWHKIQIYIQTSYRQFSPKKSVW